MRRPSVWFRWVLAAQWGCVRRWCGLLCLKSLYQRRSSLLRSPGSTCWQGTSCANVRVGRMSSRWRQIQHADADNDVVKTSTSENHLAMHHTIATHTDLLLSLHPINKLIISDLDHQLPYFDVQSLRSWTFYCWNLTLHVTLSSWLLTVWAWTFVYNVSAMTWSTYVPHFSKMSCLFVYIA